MKTLYKNCSLPLAGGQDEKEFCVAGGKFAPAEGPYDETIDLGGAAVLPAFCDAHSHLLAYALSLTQADGTSAATAQDFIACAERFARENGMGELDLVTIRNARTLPDAAPLETCLRPLHIQLRSGHAGLFNGAARRLLGLGENAVLEESEYLAATRRVPLPEGETLKSAFARAQARYFSYGVTTAQEGILTREMFPLYDTLLPTLRIDVVAYPSPADYDDARARFRPTEREAGARGGKDGTNDLRGTFRVGGVKIFLDGSPQQKTALLRAPYEGGGTGMQSMSAAEVLESCRFAAGRGTQLLAHCNGDGAAELFINALETLSPAARAACRPVLIHGQILGDDQLERIKRLGVIPSFFVAHVREFGDTHLTNLGRARGMRISPTRSALVRGIPFTLHQDAPVCEPDPLDAVACAVLRTTKAGKRLAGQEISVLDALRAVTEHAAAQYGFGDRGRIAAGQRADFVILNRDPLACNAEDLPDLRVVETYMKGRRVFPAE